MSKKNKEEKIEQFRSISRQYSDTSIMMHAAIAQHAGLSGTDHKYLGLIIQNGEMTAGDISKMTGLTTGAVTGLIDRLEKKNLVARRLLKDDRRKVMIVPNTQNAQQLLAPFFSELQEKTTRLINSFTKTEIQTIEKYFRSAIQIMHETIKNIDSK